MLWITIYSSINYFRLLLLFSTINYRCNFIIKFYMTFTKYTHTHTCIKTKHVLPYEYTNICFDKNTCHKKESLSNNRKWILISWSSNKYKSWRVYSLLERCKMIEAMWKNFILTRITKLPNFRINTINRDR